MEQKSNYQTGFRNTPGDLHNLGFESSDFQSRQDFLTLTTSNLFAYISANYAFVFGNRVVKLKSIYLVKAVDHLSENINFPDGNNS